jgi:Flp pilus assembly protein TadD
VVCHVRYRNRANRPATAIVRLPRAVSRPPFVLVSGCTISPSPKETARDARGNLVATVRFAAVPPGETREVVMRIQARVFQVVLDVDARGIPPRMTVPLRLRPWLSAERAFPARDPVLRKAARRLVEGESNPWYALIDLYDYARSLTYQLTGKPTDVRQVLRTHVAQCSDAASLLVTLARASGIPCRYVAGVFLAEEAKSTRDTHAWSQAWIEGVGEVPLDPTQARFDDSIRVSRLAEEVVGYLPLWEGTPFGITGSVSGGAAWSAADFRVEFSVEKGAFQPSPSLLERFPVPEGGAATGPADDEPLFAPWRDRIDRASRGPALDALRAEASGKDLPRWLVLLIQGTCDMRNGHLSRAEVELGEAVRLHSVPVTQVGLAHFYLWTHQVTRALGDFRAALRMDGRRIATWQAIVLAYAALDIWDGAAVAADRAAALHPELAQFPLQAGQAWMRAGHPGRARDAFLRATALQPNDGWTHAMLGWAMRDSHDLEGARRELDRALTLGVSGSERAFFEKMRADLAAGQP